MILITDQKLSLLKEKPYYSKSNMLNALSYYFIRGLAKQPKARLNPGDFLTVLKGNINLGISYFNNSLDTIIKNLDLETDEKNKLKVIKERCEFYKIVYNKNENNPFSISHIGPYTIRNVGSTLNSVIKNNKEGLTEREFELNIKDYTDLLRYYYNDNEQYKFVDLLIAKIDCITTIFDKETRLRSWFLMGEDEEQSNDVYELMNEFKISF
jgi:hypothetical protein